MTIESFQRQFLGVTKTALPKKSYGGKRQANTGSAGALARYEREARNSYSVKRFEIERAAHARAGEGARAPSTNWLVQIDRLFGQSQGVPLNLIPQPFSEREKGEIRKDWSGGLLCGNFFQTAKNTATPQLETSRFP